METQRAQGRAARGSRVTCTAAQLALDVSISWHDRMNVVGAAVEPQAASSRSEVEFSLDTS